MSDQFCRFVRLGYVVLNVKDLEASTSFYKDVVGLELVRSDHDESWLSCVAGDEHGLILRQGDSAGLAQISFEVESERDLSLAKVQLATAGCAFDDVSDVEARSLGLTKALRTRVPGCGVTLELFAGLQKTDTPFKPTVADLLRLGHLVVKTPQFEETQRFFLEVLKFRVSDSIKSEDDGPHEVAFMRCHPNPLHHSIGVTSAKRPGLHHIAFMVSRIDDIGRALNRLPKAGAKIVFGPGRHLASGSVFLYFLDPDGITVEYTFGMEEFSEESPRQARKLLPLPETVDLWGGQPLPDYASTGAITSA